MRPGLLVLNFGGPREGSELESFLTNLFEDVLPGPSWLKGVMAPRVARSRAKLVRPSYERIGWSPVVPDTEAQLEGILSRLGPDAPPAAAGMLFTEPSVKSAVQRLRDQGVDSVVALALFPQFSLSTTAAAFDRASAALGDLPVHYIPAFYDHPGYISAVAGTIRRAAEKLPGEGPIHLLFSPHGLPLSFVRRHDPYPDHIRESVRRTITELGWTDPHYVAWQSRVGPVKWLTPSTLDAVSTIAAQGGKRLILVPLSFVGEHIETLYELDIEVGEHAQKAGIEHFGRAAALGTDPLFLDSLADVVRHALTRFGKPTCVRCLLPEPPGLQKKPKCPNCKFVLPAYLAKQRP